MDRRPRQGSPPPEVVHVGYPLKLTTDQEAKVRALLAAMFAESRPKSARLLDAERALQTLFARGTADEASVKSAVAEAECAPGARSGRSTSCFT